MGGWGWATEAGHLFTETSPRPLRCVQNPPPSDLNPDQQVPRLPEIPLLEPRSKGHQGQPDKHLLGQSPCFTEREKEAHQKVSYVHIVRQRPSQYLKSPSPAARWL